MIYPVTYYTAKCDHCQLEWGADSEYTAWATKDGMYDELCDSNWYVDKYGDFPQEHKDKCYCEDCWSYADDDTIFLKPERLNLHKKD